jgi:hypothetical protein
MVATSKRRARTPAGQPAGRRRYQVSRDFDSSKQFFGSFVCVRYRICEISHSSNDIFWQYSSFLAFVGERARGAYAIDQFF